MIQRFLVAGLALFGVAAAHAGQNAALANSPGVDKAVMRLPTDVRRVTLSSATWRTR